ncbi:DUF2490 domain-containing protein [Robiginitalea sp.]|uniref:DUF2490 domain-containing protein n=1 Tax=Robiginitalea sp. TaxID=1902411 RepID=UPI003C737D4E
MSPKRFKKAPSGTLRLLLAPLLLLLCSHAELGAQQTGEEELGAWYMYFGMNRLAERWSLHTEAQWRLYEVDRNFNQLLLRTGMNYHIDKGVIATLGYAYIDTDPTYEDIPTGDVPFAGNQISENRIFEQFILTNKVWEFNFEHRYRLEQRFINDQGGNVTRHRARYRLQLTLPLTDTIFINLYDEIFINLQDDLFDQNRLYAALGVRITENSSIQIGYLKNQFRTANFDRLQFALFYNPDLRGLFNKEPIN